MKRVWLKSQTKWSNTPFIKVYRKEKLNVGNEEIIVRNDKNFQIVQVENHPELNFLIGRPFLLEIDAIRQYISEQQAAREEANNG